MCIRHDSRSRIIKGFFLQLPLHATRIAAYCAGAMPQRINPETEGRSVTCALTRQQQQKVGVTAAFPWQLTYAYAAVRCHHSGGKWMRLWLDSIPEFWYADSRIICKNILVIRLLIHFSSKWNNYKRSPPPISENSTSRVIRHLKYLISFSELNYWQKFSLFLTDTRASRNFSRTVCSFCTVSKYRSPWEADSRSASL